MIGRAATRGILLVVVGASAAYAQSSQPSESPQPPPAAPPARPAPSLRASRVTVANDAFDFWLAPWYRPDEEYTSGVEATLEYAGPAWWRRFVGRPLEACRPDNGSCASHSWSFGQQIFTGARQVGDDGPVSGSRPNAGWLYVQETERIVSGDRLEEWSLSAGVTGTPALAEFVQRVAHGYAAAYNRPVDWSRQLPFEPGFIARYERTQRAMSLGDGGSWSAGVEPHLGGAVGTILTEGSAGVRVRAGFPSRRPWRPTVPGGLAFSVFADATVRGVVRNEFLDGTLFQSSARVRSLPWVREYEAGFTLQWRSLGTGYLVHQTGPEYVSRTGSHTWASFNVEWRVSQ